MILGKADSPDPNPNRFHIIELNFSHAGSQLSAYLTVIGPTRARDVLSLHRAHRAHRHTSPFTDA